MPPLHESPELRYRDAVDLGTAPVRRKRLWYGILLAPGAWLVMELLGYYLAERSCEPGPQGVPFRGTQWPNVVHVGLAVLLAIVAGVGLWFALGNWRAVDDVSETGGSPAAHSRARFMAFAGILGSSLFLLGIVYMGIPGFFLDACRQMVP